MSNEQKATTQKVDCTDKSTEELVALAKENGVELTDDQMDQIAGGSWSSGYIAICPACGEHFGVEEEDAHVTCPECGTLFLAS